MSKVSKIFEYNVHNINRCAFLNWRMGDNDAANMGRMGIAYIDSALLECSHYLENNSKKLADIQIFPILACFNHGVELCMKAIIWQIVDSIQDFPKVIKSHDFDLIYEALMKALDGFNPSYKANLKESLEELVEYFQHINSISEIDGHSFSHDLVKYPMNLKMKRFKHINNNKNTTIDLFELEYFMRRVRETFNDHIEQLTRFFSRNGHD